MCCGACPNGRARSLRVVLFSGTCALGVVWLVASVRQVERKRWGAHSPAETNSFYRLADARTARPRTPRSMHRSTAPQCARTRPHTHTQPPRHRHARRRGALVMQGTRSSGVVHSRVDSSSAPRQADQRTQPAGCRAAMRNGACGMWRTATYSVRSGAEYTARVGIQARDQRALPAGRAAAGRACCRFSTTRSASEYHAARLLERTKTGVAYEHALSAARGGR